MKNIIGIVLIVIGVIAGVFAFTKHDDEKTLVEIGDIEIKNENKKPGSNTTLYYIIAAIGIVGGGIMLSNKSK